MAEPPFIYTRKKRKGRNALDALIRAVNHAVVKKDRYRISNMYLGEGMENKTIGKSKEEYIKTIYIVSKRYGACRNVDVSKRLGVSKASTSIAIKKLEQEGYVIRDEWRVLLTSQGFELAEKLYEKDVFFSNWFKNIGVSEETAEADACKIEHAVSEETYRKIKNYIAELNEVKNG